MATTQYIGSRYVPLFADPAEWSSTKQYEPLTIVLYQGNSFTSKQFVPVGVDINDTNYWAETGNYNAQVEQYRQEVLNYGEQVVEFSESIVKKAFSFANVSKMKDCENLYAGAICHTNGFYTSGDGGSAWYVISTSGTANEMDIIACGSLFAVLVKPEYVNPEMFGAYGDGETNDYSTLQYVLENNKNVVLTKRYYIDNTLIPNRYIHIYSFGGTIIYDGVDTAIRLAPPIDEYVVYPYISGLSIESANSEKGTGVFINYSQMNGALINCNIYGFEYGIVHGAVNNGRAWLTTFDSCRISNCKYAIIFNRDSNGVTINNCKINNNKFGIYFDNGPSTNVRINNCEFEHIKGDNYSNAIRCYRNDSLEIEGCYFEDCGSSTDDGNIIRIEGANSRGVAIIGNYINGSQCRTAIMTHSDNITDIYGLVLIANSFYSSGSVHQADINISDTSGDRFVLFANRLTHPLVSPSVLSRSYLYGSSDGLRCGRVNIEQYGPVSLFLNDLAHSKNFEIRHNWNVLTFTDGDGDIVATMNGDNNTMSLAIQNGQTAGRPANPFNGQMYYDRTIQKPIWYYNGWKDSTGASV